MRAYEYARRGVNKSLEPVKIFFRNIELIDFSMPDVMIRVTCSKGTYIRSFARDFGHALGSGGYLSALQRISIGSYKLKEALNLEKFQQFLQQMQQT
jgi:tRNA pseudouridine55 synthase